MAELEIYEFQFLIGRLETILHIKKHRGDGVVSIPHR